ncbi:MAG TPA: cupin domain-containing protein [Terriglobales bacterium]|nr:cupin domain-containing protein [Terriglobales bacterium]
MVRSRDWTSTVVVWDCTAGRFRWHYGQDEVILVVSGEAFLLLENGDERRFGAGDVGFFPAGTTATWRVADYIRKVAVVRETVWRPLGFCLKVWKKLLRMAGLSGKSPF